MQELRIENTPSRKNKRKSIHVESQAKKQKECFRRSPPEEVLVRCIWFNIRIELDARDAGEI